MIHADAGEHQFMMMMMMRMLKCMWDVFTHIIREAKERERGGEGELNNCAEVDMRDEVLFCSKRMHGN